MEGLERKRGSIVRIKLVNFMTFSSCEFYPGPRMNMILGPNGSGKSSLVCALCLGLGGAPKLLGRADELQKFVKNGCPDARIEIELYEPDADKNLVVERRLTATANTSDWLLNGKLATQKQVLEALHKMCIQVDNLCQFLPQDKVQEFSMYTDRELLRETIRVVNGESYLKLQENLAKRQKNVAEGAEVLKKKRAELGELEADNRRNQQVVQRQQQRGELLESIKLMEMKLPYVIFDELRLRAKAASDEVKEKEKEMKRGSKTLLPLKAALDHATQEYSRSSRALEQFVEAQKRPIAELDKAHTNVTKLLDKIGEHQDAVDNLDRDRERARKSVDTQMKRVTEAEAKLASRKGAEYYDDALREIRNLSKPLNERAKSDMQEVTSLAAELTRKQLELNRRVLKRMRELDDALQVDGAGALDRRREALERANHDLIRNKIPYVDKRLADALLRARAERQSLAGKLAGPLVCELRARNEDAAIALELFMPKSNWKFFVTSTEADMRQFNKEGLSNILVVETGESGGDGARRPETYTRELFAQTGILGFLDELLVADPLALEGARRLVKLHHCIVGTAKTDEVYATQPDLFRRLIPPSSFTEKITIFTPSSRIDITRSQYGDRAETITRRGLPDSHARRPLNLPLHVSLEATPEQHAEKEQWKREREALTKERERIETELHELGERKEEAQRASEDCAKKLKEYKEEIIKLTKAKEEEQKLAGKLENERTKLQDAQDHYNQDWDELKHKFLAAQARERERIDKILGALSFRSTGELMTQLAQANLAKAQYDAERQVLQKLHEEEAVRVKQMGSKLDALKERSKSLLAQAKEALKHAKSKCAEPGEYEAQFAALPQTVAELQTKLDAAKFAVDRISDATDQLRQYEANERRIKELNAEITAMDSNMDGERALLQEEIQNWIGPVKSAVEEINVEFGNFFQAVSAGGYFCHAQVALRHDAERDLMDCGAEIHVTFRKGGPLTKLDAKVQSGKPAQLLYAIKD